MAFKAQAPAADQRVGCMRTMAAESSATADIPELIFKPPILHRLP
jgi:hypothetical protein